MDQDATIKGKKSKSPAADTSDRPQTVVAKAPEAALRARAERLVAPARQEDLALRQEA